MKLSTSSLMLVLVGFSPAAHARKGGHAAGEPINTAYRDLGLIQYNEKDLGHSGAKGMSGKFAEHAAECSEEVKKRLDAGEAGSTIVNVVAFPTGNREVKLGEAEATVCGPLAARAKTWDSSVSSAHGAADEAVAAPYKAVGIGGDKLAFLVSQKGDSDFFGVGGKVMNSPEAIKKASVLFTLLGGTSGVMWTLVRHEFSGDKLVSSSKQDFIVRPGSANFK